MPRPAKKRPLQSEVMKARTAADIVLRKAVSDRRFRELLAEDPRTALRKSGVPAIAIEDLAREIVVDGRQPRLDCTETCMVTCLVTCFITGNGRLPGSKEINPIA
jgi:hypothetical protein